MLDQREEYLAFLEAWGNGIHAPAARSRLREIDGLALEGDALSERRAEKSRGTLQQPMSSSVGGGEIFPEKKTATLLTASLFLLCVYFCAWLAEGQMARASDASALAHYRFLLVAYGCIFVSLIFVMLYFWSKSAILHHSEVIKVLRFSGATDRFVVKGICSSVQRSAARAWMIATILVAILGGVSGYWTDDSWAKFVVVAVSLLLAIGVIAMALRVLVRWVLLYHESQSDRMVSF